MTGRRRGIGTTTSCVSPASRTELCWGDEGGRPALSVPKGQTPRPSYSPTGSVSSRKLANCILSRKPVKSSARYPIYQERMRQSFSYRPCYTRTTAARTLQSETRAVSCHWCRGLHLEQLPHSIGHNRLCPQMLPERRWGMARALPLSHPPTLSRLRQRLPHEGNPETRFRNSSDATPCPHPCMIHTRNAGEEKSSTLFAP